MLLLISCWAIIIPLLIMVFYDFNQHQSISFNILSMMVLIIFLILAPFADEIKCVGIKFTRLKNIDHPLPKKIKNISKYKYSK